MARGNFGGFPDLNSYVKDKVKRIKREDKSFSVLFEYMFSERNNVMAEKTEGVFIKKTTYGQCREEIFKVAAYLKSALEGVKEDSLVGIYMANSLEWIEIFWACLMCGYRPLLMNSRLPDAVLEKIISDHAVGAVITDSKSFSVKTVDAFAVISNASEPLAESEMTWAEEMAFMSSGTTENVKLCFYKGENLCWQVCDSLNIVQKCPQIGKDYNGNIKLLTILPFYHIFGFVAVYIWFGFFSRTFVFLNDMNPRTIQSTIKRHKVTHIFAVPLVWDKVYRSAINNIKSRGVHTYKKFRTVLAMSNKFGFVGDVIAEKMFKEVRAGLFGESVRFMISGGSSISPDVLSFFNGIGYHLANGYGMTELGITSVELSMNKPLLNSCSIGAPFGITEYKIDPESGELLVRSKTMAHRILQGENEYVTNYNEFFNTKDLASEVNGRYYLNGRRDDLIVCENGENLNPSLAEQSLKLSGVDGICIIKDEKGAPTLLISVLNCYDTGRFDRVRKQAADALAEAKLDGAIKRIEITTDPLISGTDFKVNRKKIARGFAEGSYDLYDASDVTVKERTLSLLEEKMREVIAETLGKAIEEIGLDDNFFVDLGGTSLDYFVLVDAVKAKFNIDFPVRDNNTLSTLRDLCDYVQTKDKDNGGTK